MLCRSRLGARARRRGVAAVELAILLPFLAFISLIAVDYCRIFFHAQTIANCARNGAIYASQTANTTAGATQTWKGSGTTTYASIEQAALADAGNLSPAPTVTSGTDGNGNQFVTVAYTFQTVTNYPGIPSVTNLTRTVRVRQAPNLPDNP